MATATREEEDDDDGDEIERSSRSFAKELEGAAVASRMALLISDSLGRGNN